MGRKLDALLGRKFKTSKFKATVNLAVSRLSILKKQRQTRLGVARSDIIELLKLNHHEHALNRVEQVIKEQNMFDAFVMMDGYCHLLLQMVNLIEQEKNCPDELKEAASSLLYAAPRCGEFPELQEIRAILTARFGKEFANGAIELRGNCGVNTRMIQKLSPRKPLLENRMKMLHEIATENGIVLQLDDVSPVITEKQDQQPEVEDVSTHSVIENTSNVLSDEFVEVSSFSESRKGKKKFRDVEDAAQAAFESAAYAAAAARAAVELSRSRSFSSDNPDSPNSRPRKALDSKPDKSKLQMRYEKSRESESEPESESALNLKAEHEDKVENDGEKIRKITVAGDTDGSDSDKYKQPLEKMKTVVFDDSDNDIENNNAEGMDAEEEQPEFHSGKREAGFDEGWKMKSGVKQLDFTKRPISVRTKRVYVR